MLKSCRSIAVLAPITAFSCLWKVIGHQAGMGIADGLLHPAVITRVRDELHAEFELAGKRILAGIGVDVEEVPGIGDSEAFATQEPLVNFHLPFEDVLPLVVQVDFLRPGASVLVDDFALTPLHR